MEFGPGILGGELPVDDCLGLIAFLLQGMHPPAEAVLVGVPLSETAAGYDAEFNLRHIQPAAMLGCVIPNPPKGWHLGSCSRD